MNDVTILGRLTDDVKLITTSGGTSVASFTLAVDRYKKDSGADFIRIKAFGKQAENISKYVSKGNRLLVKGHIQTDSYTNKENQKVYTTEVILERSWFIENKKKSDAPAQEAVTEEVFVDVDNFDGVELPF